jgi:hypothetical protein
VSNKKVAAIAEIVKMRDQLVVMRERLFQLTAATAARTKKVDGLLIDCAGAGRVFGVRIGLPDWNNVLAMPGHQFAYSLDEELKEEMERVSKNFNWKSSEQPLDRSNNDMRLLLDILATLDVWGRRDHNAGEQSAPSDDDKEDSRRAERSGMDQRSSART